MDRTERIDVTPEMAAAWLAKNPNRRPLDIYRAEEYARKMRAGEWTERDRRERPLIVAEDGTLLNGQHRLAAIVQTGLTVRMTVRRVRQLPRSETERVL